MAAYTLPSGVTAGANLVNVVNVKMTNNTYGYCVAALGGTSGNKPHAVVRYSTAASSVGTVIFGGNSDYAELTIDSVGYGTTRYGFTYGFNSGANLTWNLNSKGAAASYGVSQYSSGYAPVPAVHDLHVGSGQTYATLADAYAAAAHGDNIIVHAGTYTLDAFQTEDSVFLDKCVRIYGQTENPDDVILTSNDAITTGGFLIFRPGYMGNVPVAYRAPGIFHVTLSYTNASQYHYLCGINNDAGTDLNSWNYFDSPANAIMFSCNT